MSAFRAYQAISALAGSGKTYQLTSRYIALLAQGADPSSIVAITFTRKAAGEIFDRIVHRLAAAIRSDDARRELEQALREQLGDPAFQARPETVRQWLRALLDAMPRLRIGTIDSLFAAILKAFAVELGLPARPEMLDGPALDRAREEALSRAFERVAGDELVRPAFLEAFKEATAGEGRDVQSPLVEMIKTGHEIFLECAEPEAWGDPGRIWPRPPWWEAPPAPDHAGIVRCADEIQARHLQAPGLDSRYQAAWGRFLDAVRACDWDAALDLTFAQNRLWDARERIDASGEAEIAYYNRRYTLAGADAGNVRRVLAASVRGAIGRILRETRGMRALLEAYEDACQSELRRRGRLSFADIPLLLGRMCDSDVRLDIAYRLDGRIDHWMLDEFQDTNARQWRVIGRLADEVLQSTESNRSFFYVGDVKQAIYAWRGGESTLFEAVRAYYAGRFGESPPLNCSWRSSPVVLRAVNRAFGRVEELDCLKRTYPGVARTWAGRWTEHRVADRNRDLPGRVELLEVSGKPEDGDAPPPRIAGVCRIARELLDRGVGEIGVLVRINSFGDRIADALRSRGIPVRRERNPRLLDNGVVSAWLSLLTLADHPGDPFAGPHVRRSPMWPVLWNWLQGQGAAADDPDRPARWTSVLRAMAARDGIAGTLGTIADLCRSAGLLEDGFIGMRVRQLLDAAAEFDRAGRGGPGAFARWAAALEVRDPGVESRVTVMTVHKAKGLEFDAVILPDLEGARRQWDFVRCGDLNIWRGEGRAGGDPAAEEDPSGRWVLPLPRTGLSRADPQMGEFARRARSLKVAEELCLLYVAMTRARQGLYMIVEPPPRKETAVYAATYLREALADPGGDAREGDRLLYAEGDEDWPERTRRMWTGGRGEAAAAEQGIAPAPFAAGPAEGAAVRRRLDYRTPSGEEHTPGRMPARLLFSPGKSAAAARGVALHDLFSRIEWFAPDAGRAALAEYEAERGPCDADVRDEFLQALDSPDVAAALGRPGARAEVWREQAFEFADARTWISGRMDRVVVERDAAGRPVAAVVIDFKSDRVEEGEPGRAAVRERYTPQIELYRKVVSGLLGLGREQIRAGLVLTRAGRWVDIPPAIPDIPPAGGESAGSGNLTSGPKSLE